MFRILKVVKKRDNIGSLYSYMTEEVDAAVAEGEEASTETKPVQFDTKDELDDFVEDLLNNKGYAKSDFIVVDELEYEVKASIVED